MQHTMHLIRTLGLTITALAATIVIYMLGSQALAVQLQHTRNEAVDGCGRMSTYTYIDKDTGITTVEPTEKTFTRCLDLKNIK